MHLDIPDNSEDWIQPHEMLFPVLLEHVENLQDILDLNADYMDDISFNSVTISEASSLVDYEVVESECSSISRSVSEISLSEISDENDEFELPIPVFIESPTYCPQPSPDLLHNEELPAPSLEQIAQANGEEYNNLFPNVAFDEESSNDSRAELLSVITSNILYSRSPVNPPCSPVSVGENSGELYCMQNGISEGSHSFEENMVPGSVPNTSDHEGSETAALNDAAALANSDQLGSLSVSDSFMQFEDITEDEYSDNDGNASAAVRTGIQENPNKTQELSVQTEISPKSVFNLKRKVEPVNDDVINKLPKFADQNDSNCNTDSCDSYCKVFSSECGSEQPVRGDKTDSKQSSVCEANIIFDKPVGNNPEEQGKSKS